MERILLNGSWDAVGTNPQSGDTLTLTATVPGSTLNDIVSNNIEGCDPFWRDNAEKFQKYELYDWKYTKTFDVDSIGDRCELCIGKLDTYCDVYLNGRHLAYCDNGHISHTFPVDGILEMGENVLDIYFYSPVTRVSGKIPLEGAFTTERMHTRRMQCTYGWDWVMRFVSCGIGGDVELHMYSADEAVVDCVFIYTKSIDSMGAYLAFDVDFGKNYRCGVYTFDIYDDDGNIVKSHSKYCSFDRYRFNLSLENAKLWYPAGYGEQPLYELRISYDGNDIFSEIFGIRTVKILQTADKEDSEFYKKCTELKKSSFSKVFDKNTEFSGFILVVNGIKVLCMGGDWVPCEPFDNGKNDEKISNVLTLSREMGVNMIRVWGGGSFESKHFYNECSRLGIMVTQDFLMACGTYPEKEEWFISQLNKEAEYAAKLIRNQPCLMWWSGDNENAVRGNDTMSDYTGRDSAFSGIYPVLMELDPERDFLPSSPFGGDMYASNTAGTTHNTNYLGDVLTAILKQPLDNYKERFKQLTARFIAEEPTFGAVSTYSNRKIMSEEDIYGDDHSIMRYHTKNNPGLEVELYDYFLVLAEKILGKFKDGYDRYFKLKYIQYECVRLSLEQLKRERWFCSGVIFWMLNDCWPASSGWAFIDYYNLPKASYYSFKRCAKPVICSIDRAGDKYSLYVSNDSGSHYCGSAKIFALNNTTGEITDIYNGDFSLENGTTEIVHTFEFAGDELIIADIDIDRAFYIDGNLPVAKENVAYIIGDDTVTVTAGDKYLHTVEIEGNIILDDNYFSLLPGESRTVTYRLCDEFCSADIIVSAYGIE